MTILYYILVLGAIIFIHELGHFIFAKKAKIHCYEFSLGMGPKIFGFNRKNDETLYSIRLFPIGGYVKMAGEDDDGEGISKDKLLTSKTFIQRFLTICAGAMFNFILGIILLFVIGLADGSINNKTIVGISDTSYSAYEAGLREGDLILKVDNKRVRYWDDILLYFEMIDDGSTIVLEVKDIEGNTKSITIIPVLEVDGEEEIYIYGFGAPTEKVYGFISSIKYAFSEFASSIKTMFNVVGNLVIGRLSVKSLTGPVGIYSIIDEQSSNGFLNILYLVSLLSINVGFINSLPLPAFDGGRLLLLFIEKVRGKRMNPKIENAINGVGMLLLLILMVIITIKDITVLFK